MKKPLIMLSASVLSIAILSASVSPAFANSSSPNAQNHQSSPTIQANQDFIDKVDKYVELNESTHKFSLSNLAKAALSHEELILVQKMIHATNENIAKLEKSKEPLINTSYKSVTSQNIHSNAAAPGNISIESINTSKYWDFDYFWWGPRIYLSHNAINDVKTKANLAAFYATSGTGGAVSALLLWIGVTSSVVSLGAPIIAGAFGAYALDRILGADNGYGVYIDVNQFWTPSTKIYAAW